MARATKLYSKDELKIQKLAQLKKLAKQHNIDVPKSGTVKEKKIELIRALLKVTGESETATETKGKAKKSRAKKSNGSKKSSGSKSKSKKSGGKSNNSGTTLDINLVKHDKNIDDVPKKTQKQIANEIEKLSEKTEAQLKKDCKSAGVELTDRQASKKRAMVRKLLQAKHNITLEAFKEIRKQNS